MDILPELSQIDIDNLNMLKKAKDQHPSFGVGTHPKLVKDLPLHNSMLRLETAGLVYRSFEDEYGIWWQST